jgi:two-component system, sensor histidine kinase
MATAHDHRGVAAAALQQPKARPRIGGLGLIGFGLLVALLAVALVQARQYALVQQALQSHDDEALLAVYQTEIEYLRLREAWQRAGAGDTAAQQPLRQHYGAWAGRASQLAGEAQRQSLAEASERAATLQEAQQFMALADRALGPNPDTEASPGFLAEGWPSLEALGAPFSALSRATRQRVSEQLQERNEAVRAQNRLGLSLTVFMAVLTLAFAFIALRQLRQLRQRRGVLEELAANLGQARRDAESASQAKSAFLANISHEIRTPFHGLMGMLSLLRETGLTPKQIDYLRTATESADHLLAILNDILDMSQLESGRLTLNPAPVDLRALLRDVEALMRPQASAKHLALHMDIDPGVPERVVADATRLKQILFNLLSNAIKFSDQGVVLLHLRQRPAAAVEPELEFAVVDTGVGMDEATVARLFTRFAQGDNSRSRRHGGTGLGLEISRNLARLMHGDITVTSKPGEGSRFVLRLPLQAVFDPTHGTTTGALAPSTPGRALRVLVAEDHPVNRQYLAALLDNLGHRAHFCANGQEALVAARDGSFDLVLMDLHMPLLDGVDATRAIRALPSAARSTVPIVAMTADAFTETRERCLVAGMNDFLTKPVSPQKLATLLRQLFGSGREPPGADAVPPPRGGGLGLQPPPGQPPLLDEAAIESALSAMPRQKLGAMITSFLDQGPQTVQHLRAAVRDAQPLELRVNAHAAKGAALNLGLAALAHTAQALQEGAAHLPAHEIARLVQHYEDLLVRTRRAAEQAGLVGVATG